MRVAVNAVRTLDCTARSLARCLVPRKVGMAMAIKMAMISTPTISSINEKPSSPRRLVTPALLDQLDDVEHRHVERDHHGAHAAAQHDDQGGLEERGQRIDRRLDLLLVELADLVEHRVDR